MYKALLEEKVKKGEMRKQEVSCLKDGKGVCTIYTYIWPNRSPLSSQLEYGYICIEPHASIGEHTHINECEIWKVVQGSVEINGLTYSVGTKTICRIAQSHYCKNSTNSEAILEFVKL